MSRPMTVNSKPSRKVSLQPLLNRIDNGEYEKVLSDLDRLYKKEMKAGANQDATLMLNMKAVKALTLFRVGKRQQSEQILSSLISDNILSTVFDPFMLHVVSLCLKDQLKYDDISLLMVQFLSLVKNADTDQLYNAFLSFAKTNDYKNMQQIAVLLHKQCSTNLYYYWMVYANFMIGKTTSSPLHLAIAEKYCEKAFEAGEMTESCETLLYLMILEELNKWDRYSVVVKTGTFKQAFEAGSLDVENDFTAPFQLLLKGYFKLGDYTSAFDVLVELIFERNVDNWEYYSDLFMVLLKLDEGRRLQEIDTMRSILVKRLDSPTGAISRSTHLALIKLADIAEDWDCMLRCVTRYIDQFGSKLFVINDMTPYFGHPKIPLTQWKDMIVSLEQKAEFKDGLVALRDEPKIDNDKVKIVLSRISRMIVCQFLRRMHRLQKNGDSSQSLESVLPILTCYKRFSELYARLGKQDTDFIDQYLTVYLAVEHLLDRAIDVSHHCEDALESSELLIVAVGVVLDFLRVDTDGKTDEQVLKERKVRDVANYHVTLQLMKCCELLGSADLLIEHGVNLAIRNLLFESIGSRVLFWPTVLYGSSCSNDTATSYVCYHTQAIKDTLDGVSNVYDQGTFGKIDEVVSLAATVRNSLDFRCCQLWSWMTRFSELAVGSNDVFVTGGTKDMVYSSVVRYSSCPTLLTHTSLERLISAIRDNVIMKCSLSTEETLQLPWTRDYTMISEARERVPRHIAITLTDEEKSTLLSSQRWYCVFLQHQFNIMMELYDSNHVEQQSDRKNCMTKVMEGFKKFEKDFSDIKSIFSIPILPARFTVTVLFLFTTKEQKAGDQVNVSEYFVKAILEVSRIVLFFAHASMNSVPLSASEICLSEGDTLEKLKSEAMPAVMRLSSLLLNGFNVERKMENGEREFHFVNHQHQLRRLACLVDFVQYVTVLVVVGLETFRKTMKMGKKKRAGAMSPDVIALFGYFLSDIVRPISKDVEAAALSARDDLLKQIELTGGNLTFTHIPKDIEKFVDDEKMFSRQETVVKVYGSYIKQYDHMATRLIAFCKCL